MYKLCHDLRRKHAWANQSFVAEKQSCTSSDCKNLVQVQNKMFHLTLTHALGEVTITLFKDYAKLKVLLKSQPTSSVDHTSSLPATLSYKCDDCFC